MKRWKWILFACVAFLLVGGTVALIVSPASFKARADALRGKKGNGGVRVVVIRPTYTSLDRTTVEQGTVQAYETVELVAAAAGFLKGQTVDSGDHVVAIQQLAKI